MTFSRVGLALLNRSKNWKLFICYKSWTFMLLLRNLLLTKKIFKVSIKMFQRRRPIFQRVSNILKVSILRKPTIPRLKLPIKQRRSAKRVKLLQQYNYKFLQESQFSPLRTSVISYRRKRNPISRLGLKKFTVYCFFLGASVGLVMSILLIQ